MYDLSWLLARIPRLEHVPSIWAHGEDIWKPENKEKPDDKKEKSLEEKAKDYPSITIIRPEVPTWGVHHSKIAILIYPIGIRVMICSANFIQSDWISKTEVNRSSSTYI